MQRPVSIASVLRGGHVQGCKGVDMCMHSMLVFLGHVHALLRLGLAGSCLLDLLVVLVLEGFVC